MGVVAERGARLVSLYARAGGTRPLALALATVPLAIVSTFKAANRPEYNWIKGGKCALLLFADLCVFDQRLGFGCSYIRSMAGSTVITSILTRFYLVEREYFEGEHFAAVNGATTGTLLSSACRIRREQSIGTATVKVRLASRFQAPPDQPEYLLPFILTVIRKRCSTTRTCRSRMVSSSWGGYQIARVQESYHEYAESD